MELENFKDVNLDLIEYIIIDPNTKKPVHKKINIKFITDLTGKLINHKVYGTWRKIGFWTDKEFQPEKAISELIDKVDNMILSDKNMQEIKDYVFKTMEKLITEDEELKSLNAKLGSSSAYGADHNIISLHSYVTQNAERVGDQSVMKIGQGKGAL